MTRPCASRASSVRGFGVRGFGVRGFGVRAVGFRAAGVAVLLLLASHPGAAGPAVEVEITSPEEGTVISRSETPNLAITGVVSFVEPEPTERRFFLRRGECSGNNIDDWARLSVEWGPDGRGDPCGYIPPGWNILNEAFAAAGDEEGLVHVFPTVDGVPFILDGDREITGRITIGGYRGVEPNPFGLDVGLSRAHFTLTGAREGSSVVTELGRTTVEYLVTPGEQPSKVEFAIPPATHLDGELLGFLSFRIRLDGPAANHGFIMLSGRSFLDVPTYTASFDRRIAIAIDAGPFSSAGVTLSDDLTAWTATRPTPALGERTITVWAIQGTGGLSAVDQVTISVTE